MRSCYLFCLLDRYGTEMKAKSTLEDAEDYALGYISREYMTEISTMEDLRRWEAKQDGVQVRFYYVNLSTLDVLEEE